MFKNQAIVVKSLSLFGLSLIGLLFVSFDASAQSENEKMEEVTPKPLDKQVNLDDHAMMQDNTNPLLSPQLKSNPAKLNPVNRNLPAGGVMTDKDPKKTESTLSFNIFLYVVDKFKESNLRAD